jgi:hypothetical protein
MRSRFFLREDLMQGKWPYFAMGTMVGIIAVLATALAMNAGHAAAPAAAPAPQGTDNTGTGLIAVSGGTIQNVHDMLWIIYKRPQSAESKERSSKTGMTLPESRITLAIYKPPTGRPNEPTVQLHSVREITFDLELMQLPDTNKPTLKQVVETYKKEKDNIK